MNFLKGLGKVVGGVVGFFVLMVAIVVVGEKFYEAPPQRSKMEPTREETVRSAFSPWSGSHMRLERAIKAAMNDPKSFEHVRTTYVDRGDHLIVTTAFRGTNAFGGKVLNTWTAKTALDGTVIEIISTQ